MRRPNINITAEMLGLIAEIDEFKGRWRELRGVSPAVLRSLRQVASIESIGSSTRIEGSRLSDAEVERLLSGLSITSFSSRDEQEVFGYAEAMDVVFQAYGEIPISENHIRQLHQMMLRHSSKDERHRGEYKKLPNNVVARDAAGVEIGVVFETATPFETPIEMESLVKWVNQADEDKIIHPLLRIAVFIVQFLAIHPFQDGNGRLSRILTTLMLMKAGYLYVPFASLESVVEENKDLYYKALRRTQVSLRKEEDWEPWIGFFLRCLKKQKDNLLHKIDQAERTDDTEMGSLSRAILKALSENERLSTSELREITNANQNTLKARLSELVDAGLIERHGKGRATEYSRLV
jgi:Fic family protein